MNSRCLAWSSDGKVALLELDLILSNWDAADESLNLEVGHSGPCDVQRESRTLDGDFASRSNNQRLQTKPLRVKHSEFQSNISKLANLAMAALKWL